MHFDPSIILESSCSLAGPLLWQPSVVILDRERPRFRNFQSIIAVDVIRVKDHMDSFRTEPERESRSRNKLN